MNGGGQLPVSGTGFGGRPDPFAGGDTYRYRGIPGWDPAKLGPMPVAVPRGGQWTTGRARAARTAASEARQAEFGRHRASGLSVEEAAAATGVSVGTALRYERQRQPEAGAT